MVDGENTKSKKPINFEDLNKDPKLCYNCDGKEVEMAEFPVADDIIVVDDQTKEE